MRIDPLSRRFLSKAGLIPAEKGRGPVVLMYHSISNGGSRPINQWSVSAENFRKQLALLNHEGWKTICVRDLLNPDILSPRTVVITFDDGYINNFDHGFLELVKYGFRATWFIVSRDVGKKSGWKDHDSDAMEMLKESQLREMVSAGMEIGAHTRTHTRLPELNMSRLQDEVAGSKKELEGLLGIPVTSFTYPYGLFNEQCVEAVRKAGYKVACTTRTGWFGSEPDLLKVRRVAVFSYDSLSSFARKLAFADTDVSWGKMTKYMAKRLFQRINRS